MAFLKTPASWGLGRDRKRPSAAASAPGALNAAAAQGESSDVEDNPPLPLIGHLPIARQLRILRWTLALVFMGIVLVGVILLLLTNRWTSNLGAAAEMRVLSQKIAKSAQQVLAGQTDAAAELAESRTQFADRLASLLGTRPGDDAQASAARRVPSALNGVQGVWATTAKNADNVLRFQEKIGYISDAVKVINQRNPELLDIAEQVVALKLQTTSAAREISLAGNLVMLTQRLAKNANALLASELIDPENAYLLERDVKTFREVTRSLLIGGESPRVAPTRDPETQAKLQELETGFKITGQAVQQIITNLPSLVEAKNAGRALVRESGALLESTDRLAATYQSQMSGRIGLYVLMLMLALTAVTLIWLTGRVFRDEDRTRLIETKRQAVDAERHNKQNQDAILRLMNEMGRLADGDLTVRATVSEDITGAIADSVNYTIEELRVLVGRINSAAEQVTGATGSAYSTSARLLEAAEQQSRQIQDTSASVLRMARAINDVSGSAARSVNVARQSVAAAEQGAAAVQNAISGMNDIRGQIQDTSKRIKRLGESSQQVGEIIELISDITERTQVLALNAAIQAAAAGESGRGFTVVAEEVQRLAERSAEATRQVSGMVKTIQTDTQDAVAAMERSTQGVVDGARLSDAAGQALSEISDVSKRLAQLIEEISTITQTQAQSAGHVATNMGDILTITKETTASTKQTSGLIVQLERLAQELKASVSNFKL